MDFARELLKKSFSIILFWKQNLKVLGLFPLDQSRYYRAVGPTFYAYEGGVCDYFQNTFNGFYNQYMRCFKASVCTCNCFRLICAKSGLRSSCKLPEVDNQKYCDFLGLQFSNEFFCTSISSHILVRVIKNSVQIFQMFKS